MFPGAKEPSSRQKVKHDGNRTTMKLDPLTAQRNAPSFLVKNAEKGKQLWQGRAGAGAKLLLGKKITASPKAER